MKKEFCLLFICVFPLFVLSQSNLFKDPTTHKKIQTDCHDMVFTKVEKLPTLKVSKEVFEDTVFSTLKFKGLIIKNKSISYKFLVTSQSEILGIMVDSGEVPEEKTFKRNHTESFRFMDPRTTKFSRSMCLC